MIRGFYTARSGLMAHQEHMSVMANNLANVNTVGFKPMRSAFSDLMYQNLNRPLNENVAMTGHGVKINKNDLLMNQGALQPTDMALDFAIIDEDGFFALQSPTGEISYSRAGNFALSNHDGVFFLVNGNGDYVLDAEGETIEVEFEQIENQRPELDGDGNPIYEPKLDADGNTVFEDKLDENGNLVSEQVFTTTPVFTTYFSDGEPIVGVEQIGVYRFPNKHGLDSKDGNAFLETNQSGEPEVIENPTLKKRYIEASAVDVAQEMANVIEASKAFSFSSRMVIVADEIEQTINQLR